jgi:NTP pyrophosphatase (non-canonical NTP hydrolase)
MELSKYQELAGKTLSKLPTNQLDNMHLTMGMVTEAAELIDVFKKNLAYERPIDWVNVGEEIGDLMWYIANFCSQNNLDLDQILSANITKLQTRYGDKFSNERANQRDLKAEEQVLITELGYEPKPTS